MAFFGTRFLELKKSFVAAPRHRQPRPAPVLTPPGKVISVIFEALVIVGVAGVLAKGVEVWVRLVVSEQMSATTLGFVWALATALIIEAFQSTARKYLSFAQRLAPYFGHRIYRTYRMIRYGRA
jgi:hypothetical protein